MGTIRSNKAEIPTVMKPNSSREVYSSMFGFKDQVTLVSYVPKKNKAVKALSTMHHDTVVEGEEYKPEIIMHYNATKSGVDNLDHLCTLYTCRRKVNRWSVVLFGNYIDVGAVAAFVIWMAKYPEWKSSQGKRRRRIFLLELGQELVIPHIKRRAATSGLRASIRMAMNMIGLILQQHRKLKCKRQLAKKDAAFVHLLLIKKFDVFANPARNMYALLIANNN